MKVIELLCFVLAILVLICESSSQNTVCPFNYMYHFGDGVTDIGNSVRVLPTGNSLPPMNPPYGITFPGYPTGRWSDGIVNIDFTAPAYGIENIVPYLSGNSSNGVMFSVAGSPVLGSQFFKSRGIQIAPYAVSLSQQLRWFKKYLKSISSSKEGRAEILGNSLIVLGDLEGNDIGYALSQGKSIEEVKTYVPYITRAQIKFAREVIKMGATRVVVPGSSPIGCFPYMLTARPTNDSSAYDDLGCLKDVNNLMAFKNIDLQQAVGNLSTEFPNILLAYGPLGDALLPILNETATGQWGDIALKACCGMGGKYNYDSDRFCGSEGVPVCSNPDEYIFWDGLHLTHNATLRIGQTVIQAAYAFLNCTGPSVASM